MGLRSLFATSARGIVATKSHLRRLPSSAFRTPSTVSSATGLAGLFHPAATYRVPTLQGLPLLAQPSRFVIGSCPLVGWPWSPASGFPYAPASRAPPSGLFSVPRVRCVYAGVTQRIARFPLGLLLLQVFPLLAVGGTIHSSFPRLRELPSSFFATFRSWPYGDFVSPPR
jgi:hypothetical protein